jgi:hypothetical protein
LRFPFQSSFFSCKTFLSQMGHFLVADFLNYQYYFSKNSAFIGAATVNQRVYF